MISVLNLWFVHKWYYVYVWIDWSEWCLLSCYDCLGLLHFFLHFYILSCNWISWICVNEYLISVEHLIWSTEDCTSTNINTYFCWEFWSILVSCDSVSLGPMEVPRKEKSPLAPLELSPESRFPSTRKPDTGCPWTLKTGYVSSLGWFR